MSYGKYDVDIQLAYKVQLRGWPTSVKFASPYDITVMGDVRLLHDSLKAGECVWVDMSTREYDDLKRTLKGKAPAKKTTKRKRVDNSENIDPNESPPAKRAKKSKGKKSKSKGKKSAAAQLPPTFRSRSTVDSDDDD